MISKEKEKEIKEFLVNEWHKKLYDSDERDDRKFGYQALAHKYWPEEFLDGKRKHVHHIDFDYRNNVVSNLVVLTGSEHRKIHFLFDPKNEETRQKLAEAQKGKHRSEETRRKISEANKSKYRSEEARRKLSEAHKGKHYSEEARRKMSEAKKKYWAERRAQRARER